MVFLVISSHLMLSRVTSLKQKPYHPENQGPGSKIKYQNRSCSSCFYYSGNHKGVRRSVPGIRGRKQYMFLFFFSFLFLAALGLHCCTWAFSSCMVSGGYSLVTVHRFLITVASLAVEQGSRALGLQQLQCVCSVVVAFA